MKKSYFFVIFFGINSACFAQFSEPSTRSVCEYGRGESLSEATIKRGTVVHVSNVEIGASPGAVALGGILGGTIAGAAGKREDWGTRTALAAIGVATGVKAAEFAGKSGGLRFLVEEKQGTITALVAEADECARAIQKGDSVFIARGTKTRLIRD